MKRIITTLVLAIGLSTMFTTSVSVAQELPPCPRHWTPGSQPEHPCIPSDDPPPPPPDVQTCEALLDVWTDAAWQLIAENSTQAAKIQRQQARIERLRARLAAR